MSLYALWENWRQRKHNHAWAWSLNSRCPECKKIILKEVRQWR